MIREIKNNNELLAIVVYSNYDKEGLSFFTPDDFSQQLAYMKHPKGHKIQPHIHNKVSRNINYTQEVLLIRQGKLRVDFYDGDRKYLKSIILSEGDLILLASGGHGFKILEECKIIEIKQGPYLGVDDKVRFETINEERVIIDE